MRAAQSTCIGKRRTPPAFAPVISLGRMLVLLLRAPQVAVERECIPIQVVEGELTRPPRGIADAVGTTLDAAFPVFVEEYVRVLHEKPQANRAHLVLELKLHV